MGLKKKKAPLKARLKGGKGHLQKKEKPQEIQPVKEAPLEETPKLTTEDTPPPPPPKMEKKPSKPKPPKPSPPKKIKKITFEASPEEEHSLSFAEDSLHKPVKEESISEVAPDLPEEEMEESGEMVLEEDLEILPTYEDSTGVSKSLYNSLYKSIYPKVSKAVYKELYNKLYRKIYNITYKELYKSLAKPLYKALYKEIYKSVSKRLYEKMYGKIYKSVATNLHRDLYRRIYKDVSESLYEELSEDFDRGYTGYYEMEYGDEEI